MVEINKNQYIDFRKVRELLFFLLKIVTFIFVVYWFFGIVDEPQFVGNEVGFVTGCTQRVSRSGGNRDIYCGAKLKNGDSATFKSRWYLSEDEQVVFGHYQGKLTGRDSYINGD